MQLSETNDLIFFPTLLELKPGEEKKVRVGSAFKSAVITERSYRISFEELAPPRVVNEQPGAQIRVLTKMAVPIFVQPATPQVKAELTAINVDHGQISFEVRNIGNSFFSLHSATVTGYSKDGTSTFSRQQDGWYVLAGGSRHFELEVPVEGCSATDHIRVEIGSSLSDDRGNAIPIRQESPFNGCK